MSNDTQMTYDITQYLYERLSKFLRRKEAHLIFQWHLDKRTEKQSYQAVLKRLFLYSIAGVHYIWKVRVMTKQDLLFLATRFT